MKHQWSSLWFCLERFTELEADTKQAEVSVPGQRDQSSAFAPALGTELEKSREGTKKHKPQLPYWEQLRWSSGGLGKLGHNRFRHWLYLGSAARGKWEIGTAHCLSCWTSQHHEKSVSGNLLFSFPSSYLIIYFLAVSWELLLSLYLA